jgi:hypothetical protein
MHIEELHNIIIVMIWVGHVVCMGEIELTQFWSEAVNGRDYLGHQGRDWRIISGSYENRV